MIGFWLQTMLCGVKKRGESLHDHDASVHYGRDCLPSQKRKGKRRKPDASAAEEDKENAASSSDAASLYRCSKRPASSFVARPWVNSSVVPFFSPALSPRPDLDDSYRGMSLSYNVSSVYTASLASNTYDFSAESSMADSPTPLNVTPQSRCDPEGSEHGFDDSTPLATPRQTLDWTSSTERSVVSADLQGEKKSAPKLTSSPLNAILSGSPVIAHSKIKGQ
jgi:hypothetical protein